MCALIHSSVIVQGTVTLLYFAGSRMIYTSDPNLTAGTFTSFLLYSVILVIAYWYMYDIYVTIKKVCTHIVFVIILLHGICSRQIYWLLYLHYWSCRYYYHSLITTYNILSSTDTIQIVFIGLKLFVYDSCENASALILG